MIFGRFKDHRSADLKIRTGTPATAERSRAVSRRSGHPGGGGARPGRSETIELWPLSQGEIDGEPDGCLVARDVKQVADIEKAADMRRLIAMLAAQTGGLLNTNRLASELNITVPTARSYVEILETIYLVRLIPAWSANATTRAVATPKVIFVDPGLAARLSTGAVGDAPTGGLLENGISTKWTASSRTTLERSWELR